jgi:hypothetical protein
MRATMTTDPIARDALFDQAKSWLRLAEEHETKSIPLARRRKLNLSPSSNCSFSQRN